MSEREWKPGDVALADGSRVMRTGSGWLYASTSGSWSHAERGIADRVTSVARPLVVIDPEDREQVERLRDLFLDAIREQNPGTWLFNAPLYGNAMQAALREFAKPTPPEPTDPRAYVTDRRENVWRLLADGDWVCTSGPDIGEYIVWSRLVAERGPVEVEGVQ